MRANLEHNVPNGELDVMVEAKPKDAALARVLGKIGVWRSKAK
jgi:hypothetical protein